MHKDTQRAIKHDYLPYALIRDNMQQPYLDLTRYDYRVRNSQWGKLELTLMREGEAVFQVTLTPEHVYMYPVRDVSPLEHEEASFYLDWLLWSQELLEYAHHSGIRLEIEDPEELMEIIQERMGEDLLHVQFERQTGEGISVNRFMGYLIRARAEQKDGGKMGRFHFTPLDDDADVIEIKMYFDPEGAGVAEAVAVQAIGKDAVLDIARHVEISM
ncbi:MAG: hypothetical protein H0Z33_03545 [Bacillaceae bacterium]|nr:hypothetical protein [Bacillaceae bacterium]